ncbi:hypothetical protein WKW77_33690 [Variovorax ureilyticus]|uniref:DUF1508 domain-containing protein n=1 Tax=Variovorax ureilyticus TaxID=1836198 RepID=A0ABU8VQW2_9BURK
MADTSFEHHGHQVKIKVWQDGIRWAWSFQIDDELPVENVQTARALSKRRSSRQGMKPSQRSSRWTQ